MCKNEAPSVTVVGAGLAGSETAWQLAQAGIQVRLLEMKPVQRTPAQVSNHFSELVCSNSLRSNNTQNAVGLIKHEMYGLGSLIIQTALEHRVPAGDALAVDREKFSAAITEKLQTHPHIKVETGELDALPRASAETMLIATGPLTATKLAQDIAQIAGTAHLYFYDAIAPIIAAESINRDIVFAASRYGKGSGDDYLNCPLNKEEYEVFLKEVLEGEYLALHSFEEPKYFQGCLPIEVMASKGPETLRFGPMKPVGLWDPRTDKRPHAVVQLRQEDKAGQAFSLVGFQTKLKYPEQKRIFRMIPGLENAEFLRLGAIHRNTYLNSPELLDASMRFKPLPHIRFVGQITGVEGYVESAAHGLLTARLLASEIHDTPFCIPPNTTALGALWNHVRGSARLDNRPHEPHNINWSLFPPIEEKMKKVERKAARVKRAQDDFIRWAQEQDIALRAMPQHGGMVA